MFVSRTAYEKIKSRAELAESVLAAIDRSQAMIEFNLDGTIVTANPNFLQAVGYRLDEIVGQHHRMFVRASYAASEAYQDFWSELRAGRFVAGKFERIGRGDRTIWINANYNPVLDEHGKVVRVVKFAIDITEAEREIEKERAEKARLDEQQSVLVSNLAQCLARLSNGDLSFRYDAEAEGASAQIKSDFNEAVASLQAALSGVSVASSSLLNGADEISEASNDLSRRTEQQAANLEETAAALDQITATVQRSSAGAKEAANTAAATRTEAEQSRTIVNQAIAAMQDIHRSSGQIAQVITVIDEMAFQTNLLALNAGVEAARAGDAGRGFAVVAQEVRALAQRSAEAAREIKQLISQSTTQVSTGVTLVNQTGAALGAIVQRVAEIDQIISEIAQSSQEQAIGLGQVNTAVNQMDQTTQQNAAMVEETTAAAHSLRNEVTRLVELVGRFNLGDTFQRGSFAQPQIARRAA